MELDCAFDFVNKVAEWFMQFTTILDFDEICISHGGDWLWGEIFWVLRNCLFVLEDWLQNHWLYRNELIVRLLMIEVSVQISGCGLKW